MAALQRTFALAEMNHVAVFIAENLKLDVARMLDELFHVHIGTAEGLLGFGARGLKHGDEFAAMAHDAHAAASAAFGRLDHYRVADFGGDLLGAFFVGHHAGAAGDYGEASFLHGFPGFIFFAHQANSVGRRSDESDVGGFAHFGKVGVLGKETVAGVNRVHIRDFSGADDLRDVQIAFAAARRPDADGFIGEANVQGIAVGFGVDCDGLDAQFPAGGKDAQGDFAAIGNQNFSEHCPRRKNQGCPLRPRTERALPMHIKMHIKIGPSRQRRYDGAACCASTTPLAPATCYFFRWGRMPKSASPYSTGCPFSTKMRTTSPATSDSISFINFMASMMHSTWPDSTFAPMATKGSEPGLADV